MRIVHLNFSENAGGAARAANRLHVGLRAAGYDSHMLVIKKASADPSVHPVRLNRVERRFREWAIKQERPDKKHYPGYADQVWSVGKISTPVPRALETLKPDLMHLHWIGAGMLSIQAIAQLARRAPLVWTLHDMWAFTGGCHYSGTCERYKAQCGACPQLGSTDENDLSRWTWAQKHQHWQNLPLTIIAPSRWMAECVKASPLLHNARVEVIPNGIDTARFRPFDQRFARDVFGLPADKKLILFGAHTLTEERKGFAHLPSALRLLAESGWGERAALVTYGENNGTPRENLPLPVYHLGTIHDDRVLALAYAAADVFVSPTQQENLPNTIMEALACGVPCTAFHIGGLPDMITHAQNGYLAQPFAVEDLARGITWVIEDEARRIEMTKQARRKAVESYHLDTIAQRHNALYTELVSNFTSMQGHA